MTKKTAADQVLTLAVGIVSAYVSKNQVPAADLPALTGHVYHSLKDLCAPNADKSPEPREPAVPIKKSVTPDFIISLEDGRRFKSLKRHLNTYGMTPDEYRAKWNLPADYPMVAPNYSARRSALARKFGLGRKAKKPTKRGKQLPLHRFR